MKVSQRLLVIVVSIHLLVLLAHSAAHAILPVAVPTVLDSVFIAVAFFLLPIASVILLRFRPAIGGPLFLVSMLLAFSYGFASHYLLLTPDNVRFVGAEGWGPVFHVTTAGLAVLEGIGVVLGAILIAHRKSRSSTQARAGPDLPGSR